MAEKKFYGAAQGIKIKILDMVNAGKNPLEILLDISKMLGEISGEESFHREIYEQILSVYGFALKDKFILEKELQEVSERLKKIESAYQDDNFTEEEHKRMSYALERHKEEINRLKNLADEN